MSKASELKEQIIKHYTYQGQLYLNRQDLAQHLKSGAIDSNMKALHSYNDFDQSCDKSLQVFYYDDNSGLVLSYSSLEVIG